jgi:hypothetical protein
MDSLSEPFQATTPDAQRIPATRDFDGRERTGARTILLATATDWGVHSSVSTLQPTDVRSFTADHPNEVARAALSATPSATGFDPVHSARAWITLMGRLGYTRYVAQGGDREA